MDINAIVQYVSSDHGMAVIFGTAFAVMFAAQVVVNLTPTPKDNDIVGKLYKWLERIAGIWGYRAKMLPGESFIVKVEKPKA